MTTWREVVLGDLCTRVTVGHVGKMADEYVADGVPFLRSQNVKPFAISQQGLLRVSNAFHKRLAKSQLNTGDVVVIRTGYPGTAAVIPEKFNGSNCADLVVITPSEELNPHVLAAVFNSAWGRSAVGGQLVGSAQQHFNVGAAKALRVRLPDRPEQDRIGSILCALNDLIVNNEECIVVLEDIARTLYREWFIHYRYPGHEDVKFVDSPLGPIPDGWAVRPLADLVEVDKGLSYKGAYLTESGTPMANLKCLRPSGGFRRDGTKPYSGPYKPQHVVTSGDLVMANTDLTQAGTVIGSPAFIPRRGFEAGGIISHHLFAIRSRSSSRLQWLFESFRDDRFRDYARGVASGATVLGFRSADLLAYPLADPTQGVLERFAEIRSNLADLAEDLTDANECLTALRDVLLPRLLRGQIDTSSLDLDALSEVVV